MIFVFLNLKKKFDVKSINRWANRQTDRQNGRRGKQKSEKERISDLQNVIIACLKRIRRYYFPVDHIFHIQSLILICFVVHKAESLGTLKLSFGMKLCLFSFFFKNF